MAGDTLIGCKARHRQLVSNLDRRDCQFAGKETPQRRGAHRKAEDRSTAGRAQWGAEVTASSKAY